MIAEIIAVGSEMLTPFRQDTNSLYLTARLNELGVAVAFKTIGGGRLAHLTGAAQIAGRRAGTETAARHRDSDRYVQAVCRAADDDAAEQRQAGRRAGWGGGAIQRQWQRAGAVHRHGSRAPPEDRDPAAGASE